MKVAQMIRLALPWIAIAVSILFLMINEQRRAFADSELRTKQREHQLLERALIQLKMPDAIEKLNAIEAGMDAVRLNLIESLKAVGKTPEVMELRYVMSDSQGRSHYPDYLRTAIHLDLRHADSLLAVIKRLDTAASVWPHLLRGCAIHRKKLPEGLSVTCFYDVYVWDALS